MHIKDRKIFKLFPLVLKCNWEIPIFAIYFIGSFTIILFSTWNWAYDDPFITYRYARNIANGIGFTYNLGDQILSTTTPLFALILAFFQLIISDIHHVANLIGVLSLVIGGLFLFDLSKTWKSQIVGWTSLVLYPTFPMVVGTIGSETPLYLALCIGSFAFYARGNLRITAVISALACLTRPDGILVPALLAIHYLWKYKRIEWNSVLIFSGILLSWGLFALIYFGSPLPITLFVKQQQGLMEISQTFSEGFITIIRGYMNVKYALLIPLVFIGILYSIIKERTWLLFLSWGLIYFVSFTILGVSRYFWYYAPLAPGLIVLVGLGLSAIIELMKKVRPSFPRFPGKWTILAPVALLIFSYSVNVTTIWKMRTQNDDRFEVYKDIGEWLNLNSLPGSTIGLLEAGIIGYYSQRPIVDFAGLIQPRVAKEFDYDSTYEDAALWSVENYELDYLVLHEGMFPKFESNYLNQNCFRLQIFKGDKYGYLYDIGIYDCRIES